MNKIALLVLTFLFSYAVQAQEVIDLTVEGESTQNDSNQARQDIVKQAIEDVSSKYIQEMIGEQKFEKNKGTIKAKILKNSSKYILFIKPTNLTQIKEGYKLSVMMKISVKNLRTLLLEQGMLYQLDGPPKVIPLIGIVDHVNSRKYSWWSEDQVQNLAFLTEQFKNLNGKFRNELANIEFYGFDPFSTLVSPIIPSGFRADSLRNEDLMFIGDFLKASVIIKGDVHFIQSPVTDVYKIDVHLEAIHANNGRVIGEVIRTFETDSGPYQYVIGKKMGEICDKVAADLSSQLLDAWKRGTFGTNLLKITLRGKLTYQQITQLRDAMQLNIKEIKTLRERFFQSNEVTYEADTLITGEQMAEKIKAQSFDKFKLQIADVKSDAVRVQVIAK